MKKFLIVGTSLVFFSTQAVAQSHQNVASDRIASQIGSMFIQLQQQQDQIASLQDQLAKANARVKELEPKNSAPKK